MTGPLVVILAFFLVVTVAAIILRIGCGLVGVEKPALGRAMIIVCGAALANGFGAYVMDTLSFPQWLGLPVGGAISAYIYSVMIPTDFVKGILIWLAQAVVVSVLTFGLMTMLFGGLTMLR